uniref:Pentatricopeptide repeat-containing protein At1g80150, mitochondrial n=1 Tax=Anthurium amnicola TaxID=1678845 RepID=A0A1D1YTR6_9ARAE
MLSLCTLRRLCAAFDTVAITAIAAALCKPKPKSKSNLAGPATIPVNPPVAKPETHLAPVASTAAIPIDSPNPSLETPSDTDPDHHPLPKPIPEPALVRLKKERDPEKLFLLFQSNACNRLVVENRFAFEDTISRLAGARRFDLVEQLLEQQKALPQGRREGFVIRIIMLYGKAGMPSHAHRTFDEMHLYGCPRTVKSFNATLKVLCMSRSFEEIRTVFEHVPSKFGISLDEVSYNIIVKVMCEAGNLGSAYLAMLEMETAGIKPSVVTYTTLIAAAYQHDRHEIGNGLWNLMVSKGCSPNLFTFNVRIQYLIKKNRAWEARSLMKKMVAAGIKPDELTFNLIIKGFCRIRDLEMAKRIFMAMHGRGCKPNGRIYQTMVHYLLKAGEFDLAFRLCKDSMEKNWFPSIETINKLLEGLISISKDRNAREIMRLIKGREPTYSVHELKSLQAMISPAKKK